VIYITLLHFYSLSKRVLYNVLYKTLCIVMQYTTSYLWYLLSRQ